MTPEEMRADWDWKHAWHEAEHGGYGPDYDAKGSGSSLDRVVEIVAAVEGENDGPDWLCIAKLDDGKYATMRAGCDYTGWD